MPEISEACQRFPRALLVLVLALTSLTAAAGETPDQTIRTVLKREFPDLSVTRIDPSPIPGLYEVMVGAKVIYATADGRYVMEGDLYDLKESRNLSEEQRTAAREKVFSKIPVSDTIEFAPEHVKHTIYVFTDITCGFCRAFHRSVPELNRDGIAVRYLAFPRSGTEGRTYRDMESVWCAADPRQALTDAKLGKPVKTVNCPNPVAKEFDLGVSMGIHGTPAIYLDNGKLLGGYLRPDEVLKAVAEN